MAELFSLVKIRARFKIIPMDNQTPSSTASPAEQPPAPALESVQETAQESTEDLYVSPRKLAANRRNASRSTGPRTPRGKRRSSLNALKHGMLAKDFVIPELEGKDAAAEFRALLHALTSDLAPRGAFELLLVEKIAVCTWRMRRLLRYENRVAFLNSNEWKSPPSSFAMIGRRLLASSSISAGMPPHEQKNRETYEDACDRILAETGLNEMSLGDSDDVRMICQFQNVLMRDLFRSIAMLKCLQAQPAEIQQPGGMKRTLSFERIIQQNKGI
jgi:hypothetical protein